MTRSPTRVSGLDVMFVASLALSALIRAPASRCPTTAGARRPIRMPRFRLPAAEESAKRGRRLRPRGADVRLRLAHIMPQVASMGAAVAVADFDRDGWQDLYVTNSGEGSLENRLYRNRATARSRTSPRSWASPTSTSRHRRVDGRGLGRLRQRRLRGSVPLPLGPAGAVPQRRRPRVHARRRARGLPAWVNANSRGLARLRPRRPARSLPRRLLADDVDLWKLADTKIMPESFEYANNGGRKYSVRNRGDGRSRRSARARHHQPALGAGRGRRRPARHRLSRSVHRQRLRRLRAVHQRGRPLPRGRPRDRRRLRAEERDERVGRRRLQRGPLRIYMTNISEEGILLQGNNLWVPNRGAAGADLEFENLARAMGVDLGGWSLGAQFGDLNNDGTLDLYLVNGYVSAGERPATGTTSRRSPAATARSSATPRTGRRCGRAACRATSEAVWINDGVGPVHRRRAGWSAPPTPTTAARWRWRISRTAARSTWSSPTSAARCCSTRTRGARPALDRVRARRRCRGHARRQQPQRHRRAGRAALERPAAGAGGLAAATGFCAQNQRRLHFGLGAAPRSIAS